MKRSFATFAVAALLSTSLAGSAHAGWFSDDAPKPVAPAAAAAPAPGASLESDVRAAQLARTTGDLDGAIKMLAQMMLVYPDDPRVVGEYGKVLVQQGRSQDAVNFLKRATDLQQNDWTLYSALGVAYDQTGDLANSRYAYDRALQLKPGEAVVLNNYGLSRMLAGDMDGAQRMFAQAQSTPNADPRIARNYAMLTNLRNVTPVAPTANYAMARKPLPANAVVQRVPVDAKAGPVAVARTDTRPATRAPRELASAKPAPKKKDAAPSLRMTADASAP